MYYFQRIAILTGATTKDTILLRHQANSNITKTVTRNLKGKGQPEHKLITMN